MAVIVLRLDDPTSTQNNRPKSCPYCGDWSLQGWGTGTKQVQDIKTEVSAYRRYRCNSCKRTFRHYVAGVDRSHLTQRIRKIAGLAWVLGLSAREVVEVFNDSGIELNYMTVWREGNELLIQQIKHFGSNNPGRNSTDKDFLKMDTHTIGTSFVVDMGGGKTAFLGQMDEVDYRRILAWLAPIIKDMDINVSVTGIDGEN